MQHTHKSKTEWLYDTLLPVSLVGGVVCTRKSNLQGLPEQFVAPAAEDPKVSVYPVHLPLGVKRRRKGPVSGWKLAGNDEWSEGLELASCAKQMSSLALHNLAAERDRRSP